MNRALPIRSLLLVVGLLLVTAQCFADLPKPPVPPPKSTLDKSAGHFTPVKAASIVAALAASIGVASFVFLRRNRQTKSVPPQRTNHVGSLLLFVGISLCAAPSYADIRLPRPPEQIKPSKPSDLPGGEFSHFFHASTDSAKDFSVIRIPRHELNAIVAQNARKQTSNAPLKTQSIAAALAASIGLASVVLLRMNRQTKIAMLFVVGLVGSGVAADAWWSPPPAPARGEDFPVTSSVRELDHQGRIVFEVIEKGTIELTIGTKEPPQPVKP